MSKQFIYSNGFNKFIKSKTVKGDNAGNDYRYKQIDPHLNHKHLPKTIDGGRVVLYTDHDHYGNYPDGTYDHLIPTDKQYHSELSKRVQLANYISHFKGIYHKLLKEKAHNNWKMTEEYEKQEVFNNSHSDLPCFWRKDEWWSISRERTEELRLVEEKQLSISGYSKNELKEGEYDLTYIRFLLRFYDLFEAFRKFIDISYHGDIVFSYNCVLEQMLLTYAKEMGESDDMFAELKGSCDETVDKQFKLSFAKIEKTINWAFNRLKNDVDVHMSVYAICQIINDLVKIDRDDNRIDRFINDYEYLRIKKEAEIDYCQYCGKTQAASGYRSKRKKRSIEVKADSRAYRAQKKQCCATMLNEDNDTTGVIEVIEVIDVMPHKKINT